MHYSEKHSTTATIRRNDKLFLIDTSGKEIKTKQNKQKIYIYKRKYITFYGWLLYNKQRSLIHIYNNTFK